MASAQDIKLRVIGDITEAEYLVARVKGIAGMTIQRFRHNLKTLETASAHCGSAARGLGILEIEHSNALEADSLQGLKTRYTEVQAKYDTAFDSLYEHEPEDTSQSSRILNVSEQPSVSQIQDRKRDEASHATRLKMDLLLVDLKALSEEFRRYGSSEVLEDHKIAKAMKLRTEWKTQATSLSKKALEISSSITQWTLQDLEKEATSLTSRVGLLDGELLAVIDHVERSDEKRGLFTDRPAKACPAKLPTFGGEDHEDLITFKDKFNKAAESNKISRTDQIEKLREVLTGNALQQLPIDGLRSIDQAWEYLEKAFGNPHTCLNHRLAVVKSMPGLTDNIERTNPSYADEWYMKMENAVDSVLRMGSRNTALEYVAFNDTTIYCIISKLPWSLEQKAYEINADSNTYGKQKLTKVLDLIKRARTVAHSRATDQSNMEPSMPNLKRLTIKDSSSGHLATFTPTPGQLAIQHASQDGATALPSFQPIGTPRPPRFASWKQLIEGGTNTYPSTDDVFNSVYYGKQPPKFQLSPNGVRLQDCRICQQLEQSGKNKDVYEGHYGNYPTHCPRWSEMEMKDREKIAKTAGYCPQCMGSKFQFRNFAQLNRHVSNDCPVRYGRKNKYTCLNKDCLVHSWICHVHKEENKPLFEAHMQEISTRQQNLKFCMLSRIFMPPPPRRHDSTQDRSKYAVIDSMFPPLRPHTQHMCNVVDVVDDEDSRIPPRLSATIEELPPDVDLPVPDVLAKLKNITPAGDVLVTKVKDPPLFMFSTIPGRDSAVQIFYDSGNSHCLFQKGTPDNLWGCIMKTGPHPLGAIGATTVYGGDCWACQPMTTNGKREVWIGIEVEQITTDFPYVNLAEATAEIKESLPDNEMLQNLTVPEMVGGEIHVLLGIQYSAHFPKHIHSLESGLGIYELRLTSDGPATATIAGPHHSFNLILEKVGNLSAVLKQFSQGLLQWKTNGPPMPSYIPLSSEELELAASINVTELLSLKGITDWDNPLTLPTSQVCSTHLTPIDCNPKDQLITPGAPRKLPKPKTRLHTETREDFLDSDETFTPQEPQIRTCHESDTSPEIIQQFAARNTACELLTCSRCENPINLREDEYLELSQDLELAAAANISGEPLCVVATSYKIFNAIYTQDCDPDLSALKLYESNIEGMIKIEYRCPRCRNCQPCRDAHDTERVSLREEAEEAIIKDSVKLDYKNKRFICDLPLRGKPEEFLTTNKFGAAKILERQVRLYHKEEQTKKLIVKAMEKLFNNGHVALLEDLPDELQKLILDQPVQYFIPWRIVFKASSISTPARPVFDCSAKTPLTAQGTGGRCLNDLMCKGRPMSLNLIKMLLKFSIGHTAISGDISQFYNVFKLNPEHWNLQLFLWQEAMDPNTPVNIAVIKTLIYGNSASAPLSEEGMRQLAEIVRDFDPELADFLTDGRFVDDLNDSLATLEAALRLQKAVDEEFEKLGAKIKGWAIAKRKPAPEISDDNGYVGVAGMAWHPESDSVELKFQDLHFGKVVRGRLAPTTKVFDGDKSSFSDMDNFVPLKLTKRQVTSKFMGIFDLRGILIPLTARLKRDLRDVVAITPQWDHGIEGGLRSRWVKNFLDIEQCKGLKFTRPRMPVDAVDTKMRLWVLVDAAKDLLVVWAGVGFKRRNGKWSIAFLVGRCLLVPLDMTIPRAEMEALVAGSNMLWLLRQILSKWVESYILAGDAQIALFWVLSEKNRLGLWHRTRSVQIRRGTPLEHIYHVTTSANIADIPTRPDRLSLADVGPGSEWENGRPWMTQEVSEGILTPVTEMTLQKDDQEDFNEGFIYERGMPECLTRGHFTLTATDIHDPERLPRVKERATVAKYLIFPTRYAFPKIVRILSICLKFVRALRRKWSKKKVEPCSPPIHYNSFLLSGKSHNPVAVSALSIDSTQDLPLTIQYAAHASYYVHDDAEPKVHYTALGVRIQNDEIQWSLHYLYSTATREVEHFVKPEKIKKHMVKRDGILFHRGRILDGHRYVQSANFKDISGLVAQGLNIFTPVIDRWSPLAYSIGNWIHRDVGHHSGFETSYRHSLDYCFILQGLSLFETLGRSCVMCNKLRARFIQASMGPRDPASYCIAPAFWTTQADLFGPLLSYVPGRERNTRTSSALPHKCWAMVFVCMLTKAVNIQIVEGHSAPLLADGLTRLCCETGVPARMLIDRDSAFMHVLREGDITIIDLETQIRKKTQVEFMLCPVSGHNMHGLVESKINVVQQGLKKIDAGSIRVHATGLQTLMKLIESDLNGTPFGVTMGRTELNSPLLKLISPNQLRIGRINNRIPQGPFRLPSGPKDMISRVESLYESWFMVYNDSLLPQLISATAPKWYNHDRDLTEGDVVYFRKTEGKIAGPWTMGMVDSVLKGRDLLIREVRVRYHNADHTQPEYTNRAVRSLVRLFNVDELDWQYDLDRVDKICQETDLNYEEPSVQAMALATLRVDQPVLPCECCCHEHHQYCTRSPHPSTFKVKKVMMPLQATCSVMPVLDYPDEDAMLDCAGHPLDIEANQDGFLSAALQLGASMEL